MATGTKAPFRSRRRSFLKSVLLLVVSRTAWARGAERGRRKLYVVPNMHDDCIGWLAPYYVERNYCLYSYLDHQDLALKDPNYKFAFSEIPNLIVMMELEPERFEELKGLIQQGRVELVNAFVLEPTINIAGGEALVMQGVEGLRWYAQVMKATPRYCYMIDVTAWHEQMAQIVTGLGLEAFIYCRFNPTDEVPEDREIVTGGDAMHWIESPDGTRALALNPGHYTGPLKMLMLTGRPLHDGQVWGGIQRMIEIQRKRWKRFPKNASLVTFAGQGDYSLSFNYKGYPTEMLRVWEAYHTDTEAKIATLSDWFDVVKQDINADKYDMQVVKTGSKIYGWSAFWVNAPKAKQWYRRAEHALQAAEALATIASLRGQVSYPSQDFSDAWFLLALNMDRGPLWGIAVSGVYEHGKSWDVRDRFEMVDAIAARAAGNAIPALLGQGQDTIGLFNPSNRKREELAELALPLGNRVEGAPAQLLEDGKTTLVRVELLPLGVKTLVLKSGRTLGSREGRLPERIETKFYSAKADPDTGALVSLKLKPSGREMLGGAANVVLAQVRDPGYGVKEMGPNWTANFIPTRSPSTPPEPFPPLPCGRKTVASSSDHKPALKVYLGPLATIVEMTSPFHGGELRRVMRFYSDIPRIDFLTETNDIPDGTIVSVEFPLKDDVTELRRGIPYGFSRGAWSSVKPEARRNHNGIVPVIRWSHYALRSGGGVALLDRGVPTRELVDRTAIILLQNAVNSYYWDEHTNWMSGRGRQSFQYALVAHEGSWQEAQIPRLAWDYNAPPLMVGGVKGQAGVSYAETSENVILEALRRVGDEIELRMVESQGNGGQAVLKVRLPHEGAALTNFLGQNRRPLQAAARTEAGGAEYRFEVRPQQILTVRLKTREAVAQITALRTFDPLVPEAKRPYTRSFKHPELKGHPPEVGLPVWKGLEK